MEVAIAIIFLLSTIIGILWKLYFNGIHIIIRFSSQEVPHSEKLRTSQNCPNDVCATYDQFRATW